MLIAKQDILLAICHRRDAYNNQVKPVKADKGEKTVCFHPQILSCKGFQKGVKEVKAYKDSIEVLLQNRFISVHITF